MDAPKPAPAEAAPEDTPRQRIRIHYAKGESIKFVSHQDEFRGWERTLRRAGLPLLYKQGFNPQPHIQFAAPLGVGITGNNEPLDVILAPPVPLAEVEARLTAAMPPGFTLGALEEIALNAPALQQLLLGADYTILIYADPGEVEPAFFHAALDAFLGATTIVRERERKGKPYLYNLRPLIFELAYQGYAVEVEAHRIFLRVQQRSGATGRPDEVVASLGLDAYARTLRRDRLYFADRPEDAALFAVYPMVAQEEVNIARAPGQPQPDAAPHRSRGRGRSIAERAGDEFV